MWEMAASNFERRNKGKETNSLCFKALTGCAMEGEIEASKSLWPKV
jgi:hypothetical protein